MKSFLLSCLPLAALLVSCSHSMLLNNVEFHEVKPDKEISLVRDSTFHIDEDDSLGHAGLQILNDTLLLIKKPVYEESCFFEVWSLQSSQYLGSFARRGRGPGEFISPQISKSPTWENYLAVTDYETHKAYVIDVQESLSQGNVCLSEEIDLPGAAFYWMPVQRNKHFVTTFDGKKLGFKTIDTNGDCSCSIDIFKDTDLGYMSIMGNEQCATGNPDVVAVAQTFFPQITFIDSSTGLARSYATNRDYRKWKTILNTPIDLDKIQYYVGMTSSKDYVFALYWGIPGGRIMSNDWSSTIHVLDNFGHFVYAIHVPEKVAGIAVDSEAKYLYGIVFSGSDIVRYDLKSLWE